MATMNGRALTQVVQSAVSATGNGTSLEVSNLQTGSYSFALFQVTGTFTATVYFEGTVDGTNWVSIEAESVGATSTKATSATAAGVWRSIVVGFTEIRARVAWTSGTSVTVTVSLAG